MIHRLIENANYAWVTFSLLFCLHDICRKRNKKRQQARSIHFVIVGERTNDFDGKLRGPWNKKKRFEETWSY